MNYRILVIPLLALSLGACKKDAPAQSQQAAGEVLPGSVSDAMLPLDSVTSQPPLAPHADKAVTKGGVPDLASDAADGMDAAEPAPVVETVAQ
ncbi:MAG: hypothetical protein ABIR23_04380 [Novosphingobium sp.]